jgi:hypothetical protein
LFDAAALKNFQVQTSPEAKHRYHSQHYKNGTICDLTGEAREAHVHVSGWLSKKFSTLSLKTRYFGG